MRVLVLLILVCVAKSAFAQLDTIYTNRDKIPCTVKEVTPDAIRFTYPNETLENSLYKNTIRKIVFKSGREQVFSESSSLTQVNDIADYPKVAITQLEGEIKGLYKVGEVSASSRGGSAYSNVDRVKERALNKLKMEAVMRGGNLIYMGYQNTEGNKYGGYFQASKAAETIYTGVAYSDNLPNKDDFTARVSGKDFFESNRQVVLLKGTAITKSEYSLTTLTSRVQITRVYTDGNQLFIEGRLSGYANNVFQVVRYDTDTFTLLIEDKNRLVNIIASFKQ